MTDAPGKPKRRPGQRSLLDDLATQAADCTACPLWRDATQIVFGEGSAGSRLMLVGEQPGDVEDRIGKPFVGPAGRLLDQALGAAGIDRGSLYLTNAVKHFKWTPRGKRRLHKTPAQREIDACNRWLKAEIEAVRPVLIVCLGATAARAILGSGATVGAMRGRIIGREAGPSVLVTTHPSAVLRLSGAEHTFGFEQLVGDLHLAARFVA